MLWSDLERFGRFFDPWHDFERMSSALSRLASPAAVDFPAVNVWGSGDHVVVTTEIPGIDSKSLDISVTGDTLTLRGSRQPETLKENESYHCRERWYGQFAKSVELPFAVEPSKVEARFVKGILTVSLSRAEAEKPRKIEIKPS
jgi:HSP20 family protein